MPGYVKICQILGNGDFRRGKDLIEAIALRMQHAREKHPVFAEGKFHALGVIHAEYLELERAVAKNEGREREQDESLNTATTALRFFIGEHEA